MVDVTSILERIEAGDPSASASLLPLVYEELRRLAAYRIANDKAGETLQATALVHEAYLRLVGGGDKAKWDSRGHFFAAAAEAMRRILVDRARQKKSHKHGGGRSRVDLDIECPAANEKPDRLLAIDEALDKLEKNHPDVSRLLKLRYYAGVPLKDAAATFGISPATAKRRWAFARAFLYSELAD